MMEFGDAFAWVLQRKTQLKAPALQGTCIMLAVLDHLWIVTIVSTKYNPACSLMYMYKYSVFKFHCSICS